MSEPLAISNNTCNGVVYVDDRYFPLVIFYWVDTPDEDLCSKIFEWRDEMLEKATQKGLSSIVIHHTNKLVNPPATARKRVSEVAPTGPRQLGNYVVANSALLRGIMTALKWMAGDSIKITTFATMSKALTVAIETLKAADTDVPLASAADYVAPEGLDAS